MNDCRYFFNTEKSPSLKKERNQDYMTCFRFSVNNDVRINVFAVADGISQYSRSHIAAREAVRAFRRTFFDEVSSIYVPSKKFFSMTQDAFDLKLAMEDAFRAANKAVRDITSDTEGNGTTLSAVAVMDNYLVAANIGDSPIYYYNSVTDHMEIISELMTKAEREVKEKKYERFSDEYFKNDHFLTSSIGAYEELPDFGIHFHIEQGVKQGDMLVICSDGAVGRKTPEQLKEFLLQSSGVDENTRIRELFGEALMDKIDDQTMIWVKF